jgi:integrase
MAAFEKRGQYWRAKIRRKGFPDQSRSFDTRAEAEMWARAIESEMDRGLYVDRTEAEKNLLSDLIDRYLREVTPGKRGAGPEESRLRALQRRPIAQIKMAALSSSHIASYRDERLKQVAAGTINKELNHLAHVIETGRREWGIQLPENPVRMVRRPSPPKARDRRFRQGEEERLRQAMQDARNPFLVPVVDLAIETGMRQGELVGLLWQHIDLKHRVAHLPLTKNGEARSVPLSSKARAVLAALKPADVDAPTGPVFAGLTGEAVKRAFMRTCDRAGLDDFHFHDLRHEATSRLFEKGLNPMEVASITGHKTLQMLKRYTHLNARDLAAKLG